MEKVDNIVKFASDKIQQYTHNMLLQLEQQLELELRMISEGIEVQSEWFESSTSLCSTLSYGGRWVTVNWKQPEFIVESSEVSEQLIQLPGMRIQAIIDFLKS